MKRKKAAVQAKVRNGLIAALDVGTTKVCCLIARGGAEGTRVVGIGHHASQGVRNGVLVDLDAAEATIRTTVEAAERMAGVNIRGIVVNVSTGAPRSRLVAYEISVAGHEIGDADLQRILDPVGFADSIPAEHDVVHVIPVGYSIDGCRGVRDPRGMFGQRLGVNLHLITASAGAVRNLATCVTRCHLEVEGKVVSPYAAALGCLVEDETQLGVTLIDMGGGTTSVAVFFDSELIYTNSIPLGGLHVTRDLARGLSTPMTQAERIKTLFGSCQPSPSDARQTVEVPPIADEGAAEPTHVPRSMLVGIVRPRVEEIFEMVQARLQDAGLKRVAGRRAVLTGGACQLPGAPELAGQILDKQVRIGRPRGVDGLPDTIAGPAFATCAGLLRYAANQAQEGGEPIYRPTEAAPGRFGRLGQWQREYFGESVSRSTGESVSRSTGESVSRSTGDRDWSGRTTSEDVKAVPSPEKRISVWVSERPEGLKQPLQIGQTYTLNFKVGQPVLSSLVSGPATEVPSADIPETGLVTEWAIISQSVELASVSSNTSVTSTILEGSRTWTARFPLHIPREGDSPTSQLIISPQTAPNAHLDVVVYARREIYRQFRIHLAVEETTKFQAAGEAISIHDELLHAPAAHMNLRTLQEWPLRPVNSPLR